MANELQDKTIAFLVAPEGTEQVELVEPWDAVKNAGGTPELLSTDSGEIQAFNHLDKGDTFPVDRVISEATPPITTAGATGRRRQPRLLEDGWGRRRLYPRLLRAG